jgi:hypothetical protein
LNQLHQFLVKYNFYDELYVSVLMEYLKLTNYSTLTTLSIDSTFIRNILGRDLSRNPAYNNKPGPQIKCMY